MAKVEKIQAVNQEGETLFFHPNEWRAMPVDEKGLRFGWQQVSSAGHAEKPVTKVAGRPAGRPPIGDVNKD